MSIPLEPVIALGGALVGGVGKLLGMSAAHKAEQYKLLIQQQQQVENQFQNARKFTSPPIQFTKRIIAIMCVFSIVMVPILAPIWYDVAITMGYTEWKKGFWFLTEGSTITKWVTFGVKDSVASIVIGPMHTGIMSSIIGLYFGSSVVGNK